jgi:hypothetical protein
MDRTSQVEAYGDYIIILLNRCCVECSDLNFSRLTSNSCIIRDQKYDANKPMKMKEQNNSASKGTSSGFKSFCISCLMSTCSHKISANNQMNV